MRFFLKIIILSMCFVSLLACSKVEQSTIGEVHKIEFKLLYKSKELQCSDYEKLDAVLHDMRFFLHDIKFDQESLNLIKNEWQTNNVVLLDFKNAKRHCEQGALNSNARIQFSNSMTIGKKQTLSFVIGLPNHLNHQNPVKAPSPLNKSDMHWQWLSGYKFLRLEYEKDQQLNRFHLGSMACSGRIPNDVKCNTPNTLEIHNGDFEMGYSVIDVHLDQLVGVESEGLCMGNPNDKACALWIDALRDKTFRSRNLR